VGLKQSTKAPRQPKGLDDPIRKCSLCSPFYVKGVSLGHVGRNENLKDLTERNPKCLPQLASILRHAILFRIKSILVNKHGLSTEQRTSSGIRLCWELEEPEGPEIWTFVIYFPQHNTQQPGGGGVFIELMSSDRQLKASREGSK
jgi:hypothetical protein